MSNTDRYFYRASDFTEKYLQVIFDSSAILAPQNVLELLGVAITEEVNSLIPEFFKFLEKNYVDYKEGCKAYIADPNYVDFVIRFFRYELVEKPEFRR